MSDRLLKNIFCVFALFTDHFLIVSFSFNQEMKSSDSDTAPAALRKRKRGSSVQPEVEKNRRKIASLPSCDVEGNYSDVHLNIQ